MRKGSQPSLKRTMRPDGTPIARPNMTGQPQATAQLGQGMHQMIGKPMPMQNSWNNIQIPKAPVHLPDGQQAQSLLPSSVQYLKTPMNSGNPMGPTGGFLTPEQQQQASSLSRRPNMQNLPTGGFPPTKQTTFPTGSRMPPGMNIDSLMASFGFKGY